MTHAENSSCPRCGDPIPETASQGLCPKCLLLEAFRTSRSRSTGTNVPDAPRVEEIAPLFPELEIAECIGAGGMGSVYKAWQPKLHRWVALKVLSGRLAGDPAFAERFLREGQVLARLNHPNIVQVFDTGTAGALAYLVMEYVEGANLRQVMQAGRFTPAESLTLVQDVCSALKYAHEKGVLHRDVKPENILVDASGTVKIADFGIAKLVGPTGVGQVTLTQEGSVLGSPHYMAPEQFEHPDEVDERADIFSLGVVFYELLTGELPMGRFQPPSMKSRMDQRIDEIVMRTLEKEREARFQSMGEVRTRVEEVSRNQAGSVFQPNDKQVRKAARGLNGYALASAITTGISAILALFSFGYYQYVISPAIQEKVSPGVMPLFVGVLLVISVVPAMVGFLLGTAALGAIRDSGGRKNGLGLALFGTLFWPLLVLSSVAVICLSAGLWMSSARIGISLVLVLFSVLAFSVAGSLLLGVKEWASAQSLKGFFHWKGLLRGGLVSLLVFGVTSVAIFHFRSSTRNSVDRISVQTLQEDSLHGLEPSVAQTAWRQGKPERQVQVLLEPGMTLGMRLIRVDAQGRENPMGFHAVVQSSDQDEFRVQWRHGTTTQKDFLGDVSFELMTTVFSETGQGLKMTDTLRGNWIYESSPFEVLAIQKTDTWRLLLARRLPDGLRGVSEVESLETLYLECIALTREAIPSAERVESGTMDLCDEARLKKLMRLVKGRKEAP